MKPSSIELELRKLGLTEKEVRVYLTGLELGPSSAQKIAKMVKIARPTAYGIIKSLEEKGLFSEMREKKKRYFIAQPPERILGILRTQKREIEEKEREFIRIIAALESKYTKEKGNIKVYKGKEGLRALEEIISFSPISEIFIINPQKSKKLEAVFQKIKKRLGRIDLKKINIKLGGTLVIFDKAIFFPLKEQKGFLIESPLMMNLLKSIFLNL